MAVFFYKRSLRRHIMRMRPEPTPTASSPPPRSTLSSSSVNWEVVMKEAVTWASILAAYKNTLR